MITLIDLGALYWRNALGGSDPLLGYSQTLDTLIAWRYSDEGKRLVVCADSPRSIRAETHAVYKSNRKPKPQEAVENLRGVQERIQHWGMPLAQVDGWEADDVIATLTEQAWPEDVTIIGSEKDFFVLMADERVSLIKPDGSRLTSRNCVDKFGVAPSQMTDWLAMVGDAADGVPGCPNCGPGRAAKLLEEYGTLERIQLAAVSGTLAKGVVPGVGEKTIESLKTWSPAQALDLVRMRNDLPISLVQLLEGQCKS